MYMHIVILFTIRREVKAVSAYTYIPFSIYAHTDTYDMFAGNSVAYLYLFDERIFEL